MDVDVTVALQDPKRSTLPYRIIELLGLLGLCLGLAAGNAWIAVFGAIVILASYSQYRRRHRKHGGHGRRGSGSGDAGQGDGDKTGRLDDAGGRGGGHGSGHGGGDGGGHGGGDGGGD